GADELVVQLQLAGALAVDVLLWRIEDRRIEVWRVDHWRIATGRIELRRIHDRRVDHGRRIELDRRRVDHHGWAGRAHGERNSAAAAARLEGAQAHGHHED